MKLLFQLQVLLLSIFAINAQNNITRVLGGTNAAEGQAPYQVSIRNTNLNHICGGCILNKEWVLTIARCANPTYLVAAGSNKLNSINILVGVSKYFSNTQLGLLKVQTPFLFTNLIQPVNLPKENIGAGVPLRLTGWGCKYVCSSYQIYNDLQVLLTYSIPIEVCQSAGIASFETNICTYISVNKGACSGDEGTPYVLNNEVHAINYYSVCNNYYPRPDINYRIYTFKSWITSTIDAN